MKRDRRISHIPGYQLLRLNLVGLEVWFAIATVCVVPAIASDHVWTDSTGKYKIEAEFVSLRNGEVTLRKADGSSVTLPLQRLSKADQQYASQQSAHTRDRRTNHGNRDGEVARDGLTTIVAEGVGMSSDEALRDAFREAVQAVVGTVVDGETLIENDELIRDRVLTYSNGFVTSYDRITESQKDGLFRVRIRANVARNKLIVRLEDEKIITRKVEGDSLFAEAITKHLREERAAQIMRRVFEGFPGTILRADAVGKPRVIGKSENEATVGITVRFDVDRRAYSQWLEASKPILSQLAKGQSHHQWDIGRFTDPLLRPRSLADSKASRYWCLEQLSVPWNERQYDRWGTLSLTRDAIRKSLEFPGAVGKGVLPPDLFTKNALLVLDHPSKGRIDVFELAGQVYAAATDSVFSFPTVTVVLKSNTNEEFGRVERVAFFGGGSTHHFHTSVHWQFSSQDGIYQFLRPLPISLRGPPFVADYWSQLDPKSVLEAWNVRQMKARVGNLLAIIPSFSSLSPNGGGPVFIDSFQNEFTFVLPYDDLQRITTVDVTISSKPFIQPVE